MAIIVFDDFNRTDDPTSLGTATTGQTWAQTSGPPGLGINSNNAIWTWPSANGCKGVIESGSTNGITIVTLVNQSVMDQNYGEFFGLMFRYVDTNYYWSLIFQKFPGPTNQLRLQRTYAGSTTTIIDVNINLSDGDVISAAYCGVDFEIFVNDVSQGTYDDTGNPQNYGTLCGLIANHVSDFGFIAPVRWDDFSVTTNGACGPTYNCTEAGCVDPGDGTGTYATLLECLTACGDIPVTYNCVDGTCVDPGDGLGDFATLLECQNSGCSIPPIPGIGSERFDSGNGTSYFVVPQIDDSGDDLRSKVIKAAHVTGKRTNSSFRIYGYDVRTPIDMDDLEAGTNSSTRAISLPDSTDVTQSARKQVNVPNAVLSTIRVEGDCTGEEVMDRLDEIVVELGEEGVRR